MVESGDYTRQAQLVAELSAAEGKKVARQLLQRVRAALVLDWRQRAQSRAQVRLPIEDTLDEGLPRAFTPDIYQQKVAVLFEHVFQRFDDADAQV